LYAGLSNNATDRILNSDIKELICMNTIYLPEEKLNEKIVQLSVGEVLGNGILRILDDEPLSELFKYKEN
jgi:ribose-phosphate pyrophosphokinase